MRKLFAVATLVVFLLTISPLYALGWVPVQGTNADCFRYTETYSNTGNANGRYFSWSTYWNFSSPVGMVFLMNYLSFNAFLEASPSNASSLEVMNNYSPPIGVTLTGTYQDGSKITTSYTYPTGTYNGSGYRLYLGSSALSVPVTNNGKYLIQLEINFTGYASAWVVWPNSANYTVKSGWVATLSYTTGTNAADQETVTMIYDVASTAATNAVNSKASADAAKASADTAASRVWDSSESKSAATLAKEARDKANQALTEINNVKSIVNNIQASVGPQIQKISGLNGATCTKTTSFTVVVQASGATQYRVKLDNGSWGSWTAIGTSTTVTVSTTGAHTVYVEVQNAFGATASGQMTFFKI